MGRPCLFHFSSLYVCAVHLQIPVYLLALFFFFYGGFPPMYAYFCMQLTIKRGQIKCISAFGFAEYYKNIKEAKRSQPVSEFASTCALAVGLQWFVTAACASPFLAKCSARAGEACHGVQQLSVRGKLAVVILLRRYKRVWGTQRAGGKRQYNWQTNYSL